MKIWHSVVLASTALVFTGAAMAGDVSRGEELSAVCAACHGADGNSALGEWPKLAGQHAGYTYRQLKAYRDGDRDNVIMYDQVKDLSDQDMRDLAAFYAEQEMSVGGADPDLVERGEEIYRGGIPDRGVAACMACHGPAGGGMGAAGFPRVGGQHAQYNATQLDLYRSGERQTDPNRMMRSVAERMSDEEIRAVSSYLDGLHRRAED